MEQRGVLEDRNTQYSINTEERRPPRKQSKTETNKQNHYKTVLKIKE